MNADVRLSGIREEQLVRLDGTVLVSHLLAPGEKWNWVPPLGFDIIGPCAWRGRLLPDGPWLLLAYLPDGYPGPARSWPQDQETPAWVE